MTTKPQVSYIIWLTKQLTSLILLGQEISMLEHSYTIKSRLIKMYDHLVSRADSL